MMLCVLVLLLAPFLAKAQCSTAASYPAPHSAAALRGTCATYSKDLPDGSLGFCNGVVNYPYFLSSVNPATNSQTKLELAALTAATKGDPKLALLIGLLPAQCGTALKRAACLAAFQPCEYVDPFFVDSTCAAVGSVCTTCGAIGTLPQVFFSATQLTPSYGSTCASVLTTPNLCITGPGKAAGMGNLRWVDAMAKEGFTGGMEAYCAKYYYGYDPTTGSCAALVPKSPCKAEVCDPLLDTNAGFVATPGFPAQTAGKCPVISTDLFGGLVAQLLALENAKARKNFPYMNLLQDQISTAPSFGGRMNIPLLVAFSAAPDCVKSTNLATYDFADNYTNQLVAGSSLGFLIAAKAAAVGANPLAKCNCVQGFADPVGNVENPASESCFTSNGMETNAQNCSILASRSAMCNKLGGSPTASSSVGLVFMEPTFSKFCAGPVTKLNFISDNAAATLGGSAGQTGTAAIAVGKQMFFVPPFPGQPPLAFGDQTAKLCDYATTINGTAVNFVGYNSKQCVIARVKASENLIPKFVQPACRRSFADALCSTVHMKLEPKSLCMNSDGVCSTNFVTAGIANLLSPDVSAKRRTPFGFALPRLPGRKLCDALYTNCAGFFATLPPASLKALQTSFNCSGPINVTCDGNLGLSKGFNTAKPLGTFSCDSSLNGLPSYPNATQRLADLTASGVAASYTSVTPSTETIESVPALNEEYAGSIACACPAPLVVPVDPNSHTIVPGLCCAERCEGSLFIEADVNHGINMLRGMSIISFVCALAACAITLKQGQYLLFFASFAIMQGALAILIPSFYKTDVREVWCRDNSQQNEQHDGGMCLFQGIWVIFWTECSVCFWACVSIDTYLRVVKNKDTAGLQLVYHLFSWVWPAIVLAVALGTESVGYESRTFWCAFIEGKENLEYGLYYGSITAIWLMGFIPLQLTLGAKLQHKEFNFQEYKPHITYVFLLGLVWPVLFGFKYISLGSKPAIKTGAQAWIGCLLGNFNAGILNPADSPLADNSLVQSVAPVAPGTGCGYSFPYVPGGWVLSAFALTPILMQGFFLIQAVMFVGPKKPVDTNAEMGIVARTEADNPKFNKRVDV